MQLHDNAPLAGEFRLAVDLITSSINEMAVFVTRELVGGTVHSADVTSCPQGFFLDDSKTAEAEGGVRCTPCEPRTMKCQAGSSLATLTLSRGYYRNSPSTTRIRECPQFIGCRGGNVTCEYCATGYSQSSALSCARGGLARFLPKLLFMTLAPIALGGAILAHCLFQVHVWKLERGPCQKRALRFFLLMCYFVLPATSMTIFRTFL